MGLVEAFAMFELNNLCSAIDDAENEQDRRNAKRRYLNAFRKNRELANLHGFTEGGREFPDFSTWLERND